MSESFTPPPRVQGRVECRARADGRVRGVEDWSITRGREGPRAMVAHCGMRSGGGDVVRDSTLSVQDDGWLAATFPCADGPGHAQFFGRDLLHPLHHFGATGPFIHTSGSGLHYVAAERIAVPAGGFDCHRVRFVGLTNDHPPCDVRVTRDGGFLHARGEVEGHMDAVFEFASLESAA